MEAPTSPLPVKNPDRPDFKEVIPPGTGLARTPAEASQYITEMLIVLCNMAKDVDLKFLNYLLEMAYEESTSKATKSPTAVKSASK